MFRKESLEQLEKRHKKERKELIERLEKESKKESKKVVEKKETKKKAKKETKDQWDRPEIGNFGSWC